MGIFITQPSQTVDISAEQLDALANQVANVLQRKFKIFRGSDAEKVAKGCYKFTVLEDSSTLLPGSVQVGLNGVFYNSHINQLDNSIGSDFFIDDKNIYFRDIACGGTISSLKGNDEIYIAYHEVS